MFDKIFYIIAIIYPIASGLLLINTNSTVIFNLHTNNNFIINFDSEVKLIAISFMVVLLATNLYAISRNRKLEVAIGSLYATASVICLLAEDFVSMFIFLEVMAVLASVLIFYGNYQNSAKAAKQYFLAHITSGSLILIGISHIITSSDNLSITSLTHFIENKEYSIFYLLLFLGCLINVGSIPFSGWMVNCYPFASGSGLIYLISFTSKVSIIILLKLFCGLAILKFFGLLMIIYGIIYACLENNIKRFICYLTISQIGFILIAIGTKSEQSSYAVIIFLFIHILYKALFALTVSVFTDHENIENCSEIKNIYPANSHLLATSAIVSGLFIIAAPPFASFISKLLVLNILDRDINYYAIILLNIGTCAALFSTVKSPKDAIPAKTGIHNITKPFCVKLSFFTLLLSILSASVYLDSIIQDKIIDMSWLSLIKQLVIIVTGIVLGITLNKNIHRRSTCDINLDIFEFFSENFRKYLLVGTKFHDTLDDDSSILEKIEKNALRKIKFLHNQSIGLLIVIILLVIFTSLLIISVKYKENQMKLPTADKVNYSFIIHGQEIIDEYAWLRDKEWPNVNNKKIIQYLQQENKYSEKFFASLQKEKDKIFEELKARVKLKDQSPYIKIDNYYYYTKTEENTDYNIYCRKLNSVDAQEEVILDINNIAKEHKFTNVALVAPSPCHTLIAYSVDYSGDEKYIIRVYNLKTQKYLQDEITNVADNIIWHEELNGFFYISLNENLRRDKLMFHTLGDSVKNDRAIHHITDPLYQLSAIKSSSKQYVFIDVSGFSTNKMYAISMSDHNFHAKLIREAKEDVFYDVAHLGDSFYIKTNDNAKNFRIVKVKIDNLDKDLWQANYIAEDRHKYLSDFCVTNNYMILNYRLNGLPVIIIKSLITNEEKIIEFPDAAFTANAISTNFKENDIRINYSSLARPNTTYNYDFTKNHLSILKVQEIPRGFDSEEYMVERIFANNEGVNVPITLLYKKSLFNKDGKNPLYLYGYGSYGIAAPVSFRNTAISLVNRGFVYAVAHIRGGDDLGSVDI